MFRRIALLAGLILFAACTPQNDNRPPPPLGAFQLGHNVVVATKMRKGPVSRDATAEEWTATLTSAVDQRFGRYEGEQLYHFGISVEGFMLAPAGVPVLYNPRSILIVNMTVWDDAAGKKLNSEVMQFTIYEDTTENSLLVGSGHSRSKEEQMQGLAVNLMDAIETWLVTQNAEAGWFVATAGAEGENESETLKKVE